MRTTLSQIAIEAANIVLADVADDEDRLGCCDALLCAAGANYGFSDLLYRFTQLFRPEQYGLFWWPDPTEDLSEETRTARCIALCLFSLILQDKEQS